MLKKDYCALKPPMGWNSWDCYGAAVNEEQLLGNARYIADNLKQYGWEYVVCDIQWYEPKAVSNTYNNFTELEMDEYSRLIPAVNRFPSSADGKGFAPIAEKIHNMGLKFGIHILRGIPRQAVHRNTKIKYSLSGDNLGNLHFGQNFPHGKFSSIAENCSSIGKRRSRTEEKICLLICLFPSTAFNKSNKTDKEVSRELSLNG